MLTLTIVAAIGLIVVVGVTGIALGLAPDEEVRPLETQLRPSPKPSTFFAAPGKDETQLEILLSRLEQHVRQERAAVEMFPDEPSAATLGRKTSSPLVN